MAEGSEFIKNYVNAKNQSVQDQIAAEEKAAKDKASVDKYDKAVSAYVKGYTDWAKNNNGKFKDATAEDLEARVRNLVKTAGASEGVLNDDSTDVDIANYGAAFLNNLSGLKEDGSAYEFKDYLHDLGNEKTKEAATRQELAEKGKEYLKKKYADTEGMLPWVSRDENGIPNTGGGVFGNYDEEEMLARTYIDEAKRNYDEDMKWINTGKTQYNTWKDKYSGDLYDLFDNYDTSGFASKKDSENEGSGGKKEGGGGSTKSNDGKGNSSDEYVEFTLTKANDPNYRGFGQKIIDLGLNTDNGLWGENGDVAYYTKQLNDQGIYGNLPINKTIRLKRRK